MAQKQVPQPNGFTRIWRRVVAVLCLLSFLALLFGDAMGLLVNSAPLPIMGGLFLASLMMFDPIERVVSKFTGGK